MISRRSFLNHIAIGNGKILHITVPFRRPVAEIQSLNKNSYTSKENIHYEINAI